MSSSTYTPISLPALSNCQNASRSFLVCMFLRHSNGDDCSSQSLTQGRLWHLHRLVPNPMQKLFFLAWKLAPGLKENVYASSTEPSVLFLFVILASRIFETLFQFQCSLSQIAVKRSQSKNQDNST